MEKEIQLKTVQTFDFETMNDVVTAVPNGSSFYFFSEKDYEVDSRFDRWKNWKIIIPYKTFCWGT